MRYADYALVPSASSSGESARSSERALPRPSPRDPSAQERPVQVQERVALSVAPPPAAEPAPTLYTDVARPDDGPQILAIAARAGVFTPEEVATVRELWEDYLRRGEAAYVFRVCRDGEKVLGFSCHGRHDLTERTYDLYWIATDPSARRRGVGRALLRRVEEEVRQAGGRLLVVETSGTPAYAPTRDFYRSCGYELEATIHDFYRAGDDLVIFTKHLG
ncbi:MAG: GNAT family N-acetyltransferase [Chloroflexia bacterium]